MTQTDRKELISWLENRYKETPMPGAKRMFKLALEAAEAENQWIPVSGRLPEDSEPVYVYCPTGRGSVGATMGMMARAHKYTGYTHWMPRAVPEPPKGEIE